LYLINIWTVYSRQCIVKPHFSWYV